MKMISQVFAVILIIALTCMITLGLSNYSEDYNENRFVEIEKGFGYTIGYDKYTNVMYLYTSHSGLSPIYNADGSLYLYGTVRTIG